MSRGPGRIERAIEAVFAAEPDDAFTTEDLCERVYRGVKRVERKHRVALARAAKKVCERSGAWDWWISETRGGSLVFGNRYEVMSYATRRLKVDSLNQYRGKDSRTPDHWKATPETIRAELAPGGKHHKYVVEGGAWWRHVQLNIAERDGDNSDRIKALRAEQDRANALWRPR